MLNISRLLLRNLTEALKCGNHIRFQSSRKMLEEPGTVCCTATSKKSDEICAKGKDGPKGKKTLGPYKAPKSECIDNPCCPDPNTTYDDDYKHLLKHKKRTRYQKTWKECPPRRLVQKLACGEPLPDVTCISEAKEKSMAPTPPECPKGNTKCPKITLPGCRRPEERKMCKRVPTPSNCEKIKCPYPAFSECRRALPKPARPVECGCLRMRGQCEVYQLLKSKGKLKIKRRK